VNWRAWWGQPESVASFKWNTQRKRVALRYVPNFGFHMAMTAPVGSLMTLSQP